MIEKKGWRYDAYSKYNNSKYVVILGAKKDYIDIKWINHGWIVQ